MLVSHLWFGGWSFLKLPKPIYALLVLGIALAGFGLLRLLIKDRFRTPELFVLTMLYGFFWLGLLYDILVVSIATGVSATDGWYMYAVVLPEVLLVALGLFAVVPERRRTWILPTVAAAFAAIDLYGVTFLLAPYYTGLIAHVPGSDVVKSSAVGNSRCKRCHGDHPTHDEPGGNHESSPRLDCSGTLRRRDPRGSRRRFPCQEAPSRNNFLVSGISLADESRLHGNRSDAPQQSVFHVLAQLRTGEDLLQ